MFPDDQRRAGRKVVIIKETEGSVHIPDSPGYLEVVSMPNGLTHFGHFKVYELSDEIDLNKEGLVANLEPGTT